MDNESIASSASRGGLWFAATSFVGQIISWVFTFYVIRLLDPKDFGLMTMASLLTAYLQMFSELGLGAAIIQRSTVDQPSLSSAFWLVLGLGIFMAACTLGLAYPTAAIFSNTELIPVTQLISILFISGALSTIPYHLLARNFEFKKIGIINLVGMLVSSIVSVIMALHGYGVYALIWTTITLSALKGVLFFLASRWSPTLHFSFAEVKPYLRYGIVMALSGTSLKLYQTLDKLVIGRFFGATPLGLYQNASSISSMPLDKIWPVFQQILFPLFSRLREDQAQCNRVYLETLKHYLLIVSPIYLGSAIVADDLVLTLLGEKWIHLSPLLQIFCVAKIFQMLSSYHVVLDNTTGRHKSALAFNFASALLIPALMWVGSGFSFDGAMLPWITAYPLLCISWIIWSLRKNNIPLLQYASSVYQGFQSAIIMAIGLVAYKMVNPLLNIEAGLYRLIIQIVLGGMFFSVAGLLFQRPLLTSAIRFVLNRGSNDVVTSDLSNND